MDTIENISLTEKDYIEFNKEKYDKIRTKIFNAINDEIKSSILYNFEIMSQIYNNIDIEYKDVWQKLVKYVEGIKNGIITSNGTLIASKYNEKYKAPTHEFSAWQIFKEKLKNKKVYSFEEIESLEKNTLKIINNLSEDTSDGTPVKGLVMGYVQSGKTNSIESIVTMAADYGYNVFIVLSGIIENLRMQNLNRFRNDIVFSRPGNIHWEFIDNPTSKSPKAYDLINSNKKIVIISLKNSKRLSNIKKWLFDESSLSLRKAKVLVIDDEADQAGLNTKDISDEERSKINALITGLIDDHLEKVGSMNYIGYTATPYGNFLNEVESIYPKDFIYMLPKSPKYIGAQEIFGNEELEGKRIDGLNIKRLILEDEIEQISEIECGNSRKLPSSLKDAICWFICTLAIFRLNDIKTPVTMLIHKNRKTNTHKNISDVIAEWINNSDKIKLVERCKNVYNREKNILTKTEFCEVMTKYDIESIEDYPCFDQIKEYIEEIINIKVNYAKNLDDKIKYHRGIHSVIDNCKIKKILDESEHPRLVYPDKHSGVNYATGFIVTGGDTLSRGLTLEGLTTTYFCREVKTVDTLMQMGRWFGYRVGYELLPRLWMDDENKIKFLELTKVEMDLRNDLEKYELGMNPLEYGPVINETFHTRLTSKSKMQSAVAYNYDYCGVKTQTILYDKEESIHLDNLKLTNNLIYNLDFKKAYNSNSNLLCENVECKLILDYLKEFKFCNKSTFFRNIDSCIEWIENNNIENLKEWNIILAGVGEIINDKCVNKVYRSKLIDSKELDYFNIGALRNTKDIISDLNPEKYAIDDSSEKTIIESRDKCDKPQLIIYRINGKGKSQEKSKNREDINMECDIIGLYLFIPGKKKKSNIKAWHIDSKRKKM